MTAPKYNPQTKKFEFPKGESVAEPSEFAYVAIPKTTIAQLAAIGKKDGAEIKGGTDRAIQTNETKVARVYVLQAISDWLDARKSAEKRG